MGDIAARTQVDEEWFYRNFGVDGEILIDHAWGQEPVTMKDIKEYRSEGSSLSHGQVLASAYKWNEARTVMAEMCETLCAEMVMKGLASQVFAWWVSFDFRSLEVCPEYEGQVTMDFYGRMHPVHQSGTVRVPGRTNSLRLISEGILRQFDMRVDRRLLIRKIGISALNTETEKSLGQQMSLLTDAEYMERERKIQGAMVAVRKQYGAGALFKGINLREKATTQERNLQIGGHRA